MNQWIAGLPKPLLAVIAIVFAFVVIVLNDPPKTVCDSQLANLRESQREFLYYRSGAGGANQPALVNELYALCQSNNSPGGCFELFQRLKKLEADLNQVPAGCAVEAGEDPQVRGWLLKSLKLMTRIAWGDQGPQSSMKRQGWFDSSDVALFCGLKKLTTKFLGEEEFVPWRDAVVAELPGAEKLEHEQVWQRSLFATPCEAYR